MFENTCIFLVFFGLGMIAFGFDQLFTVKYGEKWYPGLSTAFWKVSDETSKIFIKVGFFVVLAAITLITLLY